MNEITTQLVREPWHSTCILQPNVQHSLAREEGSSHRVSEKHGPQHLLPSASAVCDTCKEIYSTALLLETKWKKEKVGHSFKNKTKKERNLSLDPTFNEKQTSWGSKHGTLEIHEVTDTGVGGMWLWAGPGGCPLEEGVLQLGFYDFCEPRR